MTRTTRVLLSLLLGAFAVLLFGCGPKVPERRCIESHTVVIPTMEMVLDPMTMQQHMQPALHVHNECDASAMFDTLGREMPRTRRKE